MFNNLFSFFNKKLINFKKIPKKIILLDYFKTFNKELIIKLQIKYNVKIIDFFNTLKTNYNEKVDLIIICNNIFYIKIDYPIILAESELFYSNKSFSENVFINSLIVYEKCEKRNGK